MRRENEKHACRVGLERAGSKHPPLKITRVGHPTATCLVGNPIVGQQRNADTAERGCRGAYARLSRSCTCHARNCTSHFSLQSNRSGFACEVHVARWAELGGACFAAVVSGVFAAFWVHVLPRGGRYHLEKAAGN